ncbi:hypothetical protein [Gemmata sp.]|uniref:hypothetical protein n=1 Tax=Gemmata sp. TaxID=1914242 RepID=UPI003F70B3FE
MATTTPEHESLPPAQMQILRAIGRHIVGVLREGASEARVNAFTLLFDAGYIRDIPVEGYDGIYLLSPKGTALLAHEKLLQIVREGKGGGRLDWSTAPTRKTG